MAALQHLPARQRAVLILREVLGFSAREVAQSLDTTAASVNSALQRARRTVEDVLPEQSQQATLRSLGDDALRGLVERYVAAWESRNVDAMVSLLVEDATFAMPPFPCWFSGREDVAAFVSRFTPTLRYVATRAGGQPAVAWYILAEERGVFMPASIEVLALEGERVKEITAFADTESLFPRFGLPAQLPASDD
ncbi:MAG TPA: sigma factor-like helix-turn-helix DNA-binding protein [Gaiellaceae bacterium]